MSAVCGVVLGVCVVALGVGCGGWGRGSGEGGGAGCFFKNNFTKNIKREQLLCFFSSKIILQKI